jgi:hypothetical protein
MLPWSAGLAGRIDEHVITSELLRDNPLGDPSERPLWVYVPPGYDGEPGRRYPAVYVIQGYTGHLAMWRNRNPYRQPFPETADAVFADGAAPPSIVVYVDAWTAYGGSQFVDSHGTGRYHSYLCDEVVPWVDERYRTMPAAGHRAIMGKSSGGFGAMITPMLRPDLFGALATHAGDALYENCYIPEFGTAVRLLRDYDGDIWRWWDDFRARPSFTREADQHLLMLLGVSACFSAREDGTVELTGTRCGWRRGTLARSGRCGRSGSTREPGTITSSTLARRHSGWRCTRPGSPTMSSGSSCSTPRTPGSITGIRSRLPGSASASPDDQRAPGRFAPGRRGVNDNGLRYVVQV